MSRRSPSHEARSPGAPWTGRLSVILLLAAAMACADFESPGDPTGGLRDDLMATPSFAADIQPILQVRCATGGCHSPASMQAGLDLDGADAYDAIVGVDSRLHPGIPLVKPLDADSSWVVRMIGPDPAARDGLSRMPLASYPLTPNQIQNIRRWIDQGAQRN